MDTEVPTQKAEISRSFLEICLWMLTGFLSFWEMGQTEALRVDTSGTKPCFWCLLTKAQQTYPKGITISYMSQVVLWKPRWVHHQVLKDGALFLGNNLTWTQSYSFLQPWRRNRPSKNFSNLSWGRMQHPWGIITRWTSGWVCVPRGCGSGTDPGSSQSPYSSCWLGMSVRMYTWACGSSWRWGTTPLQPHSVDPGSITNEVIQEWIWKRRH